MADLEQMPFDAVEFADNPQPRCPCVLLLDTSYSMNGEKIAELSSGLASFAEELRSDPIALKRVEVAIITFGPVQTIQNFVTADLFQMSVFDTTGNTPMGAAILNAIELVEERKTTYRNSGIGYFRPWIFLITDGAPTDSVSAATAAIQEAEASKSLVFYAVGVNDADMSTLAQISVRQPLKLRGLAFRELFLWLSKSLTSVSRSQPGDSVPLDNPTAPDGWAVVE